MTSQYQYPIITICGSLRFYPIMLEAAQEWTRRGYIVLMPHVLVEDQTSQLKAPLDDMHRNKIDMSASILVVTDRSGYYGDSTAGEIAYAESTNKPIRHYEGDMPEEVYEPPKEIPPRRRRHIYISSYDVRHLALSIVIIEVAIALGIVIVHLSSLLK